MGATAGYFAAMRIKAFSRELGAVCGGVILRLDGGAAIKAVVDDVAPLRPSMRTIWEEAPRGSSGSNGIVEISVQSVTYQNKVLKYWLEDKWGCANPTLTRYLHGW